ncbi:hypothetical protein Tco_1492277 [Tanacetum coccineum]
MDSKEGLGGGGFVVLGEARSVWMVELVPVEVRSKEVELTLEMVKKFAWGDLRVVMGESVIVSVSKFLERGVGRGVWDKGEIGLGTRAQVDQESQIKMIQVKEMMQDNDLKNSKSKDKGSRSRSQSMNDQSHYKQDKTKTRQSINVKSHIFNVIGSTEEFEERDLNIGGDC